MRGVEGRKRGNIVREQVRGGQVRGENIIAPADYIYWSCKEGNERKNRSKWQMIEC